MSQLKISPSLSLPVDVVTEKLAILGRTGMGKSYTGSVLAEELLVARQQIVAIDMTGAWWGLRSSADGAGKGLPIYILGGKRGDIPLEATAGKLIADAIASTGMSAVLDLSLFESRAAEVRFVTDFCTQLFRVNERPLHLFIDEGDSFAPQSPMPEERRCLGAVELVMKRGRIKGIGATILSQRSAAVNKNVLSQAGILVALQMTDKRDKAAIRDWANSKDVTPEQLDELVRVLATLPKGTAMVCWPQEGKFVQVKIRKRKTFDSGRTPKVGEQKIEPRALAPVDLDRLKSQMASTIERAKQEDPKLLRARISDLERQLATKRPAAAAAAPARTIEKRVEVPILKEAVARSLEASAKKAEQAAALMRDQVAEIRVAVAKARTPASSAPKPYVGPTRSAPAPKRPVQLRAEPANGEGATLKAGERLMLQRLAQRGGAGGSRDLVAVWTGFSATGGTFSSYLSRLKKAGFVDELANGTLMATDRGVEVLAGDVPPPPSTTEEVVALWRPRLKSGERAMLEKLVAAGGQPITREELGDATGFAATGGTFSSYLSTLRRGGLAVIEGDQVRASEELFPNGAQS